MSRTESIRIASRGSALALAQANQVLRQCQTDLPQLAFEILVIKTTGDKLQTASLAGPNLPKGLFTKELEHALLNGEADLAVHSLKDLPTELPDGLTLASVTQRADPRDVLITRKSTSDSEPSSNAGGPPALATLPRGAVVGTSSTRREAQLRDARPDLQFVPIRGNVGTRLEKLAAQSGLQATVLAAAGLYRLGFTIGADGALSGPGAPDSLIAARLPADLMLPCVGQAFLGIETRLNDPRLESLHAVLNHPQSAACARAERSFLRALGGGCQLAVAALAEADGDDIHMRAVSFLGSAPVRVSGRAPMDEAEQLGRELAAKTRK